MNTRIPLYGLCVAALSLTLGCAASRTEVMQVGQMHDVLSGGAETAPGIVELDDVLQRPHAYGVGALAGLAGEITIDDGRAWIARPDGGALQIEGPLETSTDQAALLTVAYVDDWQSVRLDRDLAGDALEQFIADQAAAAGLDAGQPFPFVLDGELTDLDIHVINGICPMRPGTRLTADQEPWRLTIDQPTPGRVVGIYAADAVGKLTHAGTAMHAHALVEEDGREVTGHIERLGLASGTELMLPRVR